MMWFQPGHRLSCSVEGPTWFTRHGRMGWVCCSPYCDQQAHALQALPWCPSTSHSSGSWLCDFPHCCRM